jgi:hypothetical protein
MSPSWTSDQTAYIKHNMCGASAACTRVHDSCMHAHLQVTLAWPHVGYCCVSWLILLVKIARVTLLAARAGRCMV